MESEVKACRICHSKKQDMFLCDGLVSVSFAKLAKALKGMYGQIDIEFVELDEHAELFWRRMLDSQLRMMSADPPEECLLVK